MSTLRFADIAVNLSDPMFLGITRSTRQRYPNDQAAVVARAREHGVERILITGVSLSETKLALALAQKYKLHATAGVHPTSTGEMETHPGGPEQYLRELREVIAADRGEGGSKRIIAVGEIGLDYDRLHFSPRDVQLRHLPSLLSLSREFQLPMFLHSRHPEAHIDFLRLLDEAGWTQDQAQNPDGRGQWPGAVVHSFTGTRAEMEELVSRGLYVGINGCSLRTDEGLEMVGALPLSHLLLETDSPWCSITSTHASHARFPQKPVVDKAKMPERWKEGMGVKGRNEPAEMRTIAATVAGVKGISLDEVADAAWRNSCALFWKEDLPASAPSAS